jgi:hypothetical protein
MAGSNMVPKIPTNKAMIALAALVVELPFLIGFLLVHLMVACPHCRGVWGTRWPMLPGIIPCFLLRLPAFSEWVMWIAATGFTLAFIAVLFTLSHRSTYWRFVVGAGFLLSCLLAGLTHAMIAA